MKNKEASPVGSSETARASNDGEVSNKPKGIFGRIGSKINNIMRDRNKQPHGKPVSEEVEKADSKEAGWDTVDTVPFSGGSASDKKEFSVEDSYAELEAKVLKEMKEEAKNRAEHKKYSLEEIRKIHIDYLNGTYKPSLDEMDLINNDRDFYQSNEYRDYKKQEIDKIAAEHADVYTPSDEKVINTIKPFLDSVSQDMDALLRISQAPPNYNFNKEEPLYDNFFEMVMFFSNKFDVWPIPTLEIVHDSDKDGGYIDTYNKIVLDVNETNNMADYVNTITHEMWHAHQHRSKNENKDYKINFENYYDGTVDYHAYRNQLIEKEAFKIGTFVEFAYIEEDLKGRPERIPDLKKKYHEWESGKYKPSSKADEYYMCMAVEKFPE